MMDRRLFKGNILTQILFWNMPRATHFCGLPSPTSQYETLQRWSSSSKTFPSIPLRLVREEREFPELAEQNWASFWVLFPHCGSWAGTQMLSCEMINNASYATNVRFETLPELPWRWKRFQHPHLYPYKEEEVLYALQIELICAEGFTAQEVRLALGQEFYLPGVEIFHTLGLIGDSQPKSFEGRTIVPLGAVILEDSNADRQGAYDIVPYIQCGKDEYSVSAGWAHQMLETRHYVPIARTRPVPL